MDGKVITFSAANSICEHPIVGYISLVHFPGSSVHHAFKNLTAFCTAHEVWISESSTTWWWGWWELKIKKITYHQSTIPTMYHQYSNLHPSFHQEYYDYYKQWTLFSKKEKHPKKNDQSPHNLLLFRLCIYTSLTLVYATTKIHSFFCF